MIGTNRAFLDALVCLKIGEEYTDAFVTFICALAVVFVSFGTLLRMVQSVYVPCSKVSVAIYISFCFPIIVILTAIPSPLTCETYNLI